MPGRPGPSHRYERSAGIRRPLAFVGCGLAVLVLAGCAAKKEESFEEGLVAAQRAAQAQAQAQADDGMPGLQGPGSPVPSVMSGEGRITLAAPTPPRAKAPQGDDFDTDDPGHLLTRCRDRVARQEWFDAAGDCRRVLELRPGDLEAHVELMRILVSLQAYGDAEASARAVLAARPGDPVALYYLAWSYKGRGIYPEAIAALEKAVAADPKRVEYLQALGLTYCLDQKYGKGIAVLEKAVAMRPKDQGVEGSLNSARATLAEKLGPWIRLVREKPDSYDSHAALGWYYQIYGLPERALASYDTALAKMPGPLPEQDAEVKKLAAQVYYNRGMVYRELGRPALAEPAYWQAMQLDPSLSALCWHYVGLCRSDAGDDAKAVEALKRSIDLAPNVADNREALSGVYAKLGKTGPATEQRNLADAIRAREKEARDEMARQAALDTPPAAPTVLPQAESPAAATGGTEAAEPDPAQ